jgi:RNA polymerase sigma-70 factor (ECF subfamily)
VGGFGVTEIARAFLARPDAIAQRLVRARRALRDSGVGLALPGPEALGDRLESVHDVLYLMFNEGYEAATGAALVRAELCAEAIRLAELVAAGPVGDTPATDALLALMYLQASRLPARTDAAGALLPLEEQAREAWDRSLIARGLHRLGRSARGGRETRYHIEAAIAACHAVAPAFGDTDWARIELLYGRLQDMTDSPVVALNRAVALCMLRGPAAALRFLDEAVDPAALAGYLPWHATLGELHRRSGDGARAAAAFRAALALPVSGPERAFLRARLAQCEDAGRGFVAGR